VPFEREEHVHIVETQQLEGVGQYHGSKGETRRPGGLKLGIFPRQCSFDATFVVFLLNCRGGGIGTL
jgi:hypothetical protein